MDSFEHVGEWWLPGKCNEKHYGRLTFAPNDWAKLEITIEGADDSGFAAEANPIPHSIVLGTMNASDVTLQHCELMDTPFAMSQSHISRKRIFLIKTVFVGAHFESVDDILLDKLTLGYTHLVEWMGQYNFKATTSSEHGGFSVTYTPFDPVNVIANGFNIEFSYHGDFRPLSSQSSWFSLRDQAQITLRPNSGESMSYWDYLPVANFVLPTLLTMATGQYNYPLNINALTSTEEGSGLSIYFPIPDYQDKSVSLTRGQMLFGFEDLHNNGLLEQRLSKWIEVSEKLRTVLDLYFRFHYQKDLDVETKFLFLVQMMESYQRTMYNGKYPTQQPYRVVEDSLIAAIPLWVEDPLCTNLKSMIRGGNRFSLKSRILHLLEEVLSDHTSLLRSMIGNFDDFVTKVAGLRNNLSHRSQRPPEEIVPKAELPEFVAHVETILRLCFLVEIGFTTDEIKRLWENYRYKPLRY